MLRRWKKHQKEQDGNTSFLRRAGFTLVETMVSVTLLMILMAMVVGIVSPAFKVFIKMQKLQFAQMILDNVVEDVQDSVREAATYVKIYSVDDGISLDENGNIIVDTNNCVAVPVTSESGKEGKEGIKDETYETYGPTLEYQTTDGFVVLVSTGGCATSTIYTSNKLRSSYSAVEKGRLLYRYYKTTGSTNGTEKRQYYYFNTVNYKDPIVRAATTAFGSGYYMGNYLKVEFAFPITTTTDTDGNTTQVKIGDGEQVKYLKAKASLYSDKSMTDLVVSEEFVIDLRYNVERENDVTAISTPANLTSTSQENNEQIEQNEQAEQ